MPLSAPFPIRPLWFRSARRFRWQVPLRLLWLVPALAWLLLGTRYVSHWPTFAGATLINSLGGIGSQVLISRLTQRIAGYYPDLRQTGLRIGSLLFSYMLVTTVVIVGTAWAYEHGPLFGFTTPVVSMTHILLLNLVVNLISVGVFESQYSMGVWRASQAEKEQLKKINLQSQYESLKNQVNPHFLFNTLNSLSSLIADEPERAEEFVDEMAKVYRYLLQTNRQTDDTGELTTLATEMAFIQSYFHLLKTRYGAGIQLDIALDAADMHRLLPPLTLQMLVENAVKHNVIHANKPLIIEIRSGAAHWLVVRNNLQRKTTRVISSQVGLSNIAAKYRLLFQHRPDLDPATTGFTVTEANACFTVSLCLLNPAAS